MSVYALFFDGELSEQFETTEELAKQRFAEEVELDSQEGEQLYDSIELFELKPIEVYKYEYKDEVNNETKKPE